jgi:predicted Holliday junction resolvase-like endonuclease
MVVIIMMVMVMVMVMVMRVVVVNGVVERRSRTAESLSSTLRRTSRGIQREFARKERFWLEERRKRVRGYDRIPGREEPHKLRESTKTRVRETKSWEK